MVGSRTVNEPPLQKELNQRSKAICVKKDSSSRSGKDPNDCCSMPNGKMGEINDAIQALAARKWLQHMHRHHYGDEW
ncbi:unnamed protein product [Heligmosomoides polygyrus]|uniref:Uncharacterized protein n=1 Tax=Heligmosomoides polygyrus TaxID=6339 RepID=A0A183FKD0_HELPZ|nr:unnamed protein product [Heligmosomoides polygyrus]